MHQSLRQHSVFHLTGRLPPAGPGPIDAATFRPALLARYRDLARLRYDFPVVLTEGTGSEFVHSLSAIIDALLTQTAPRGIDGEALRRQAIGAERTLRRLLAQGAQGTLSELWERAVSELAREAGAAKRVPLLRQIGAALPADGLLLDCDPRLPGRLVAHAWKRVEQERAARTLLEIKNLIARLSDILRADHVRSDEGRRAAGLRAAVGTHHQPLFDFDALAGLLQHAPRTQRIGAARRARIESVLEVLRSQRFFPAAATAAGRAGREPPYVFAFSRGADAVAAFRARLPALVAVVRAMALAELEAAGRYDEPTHDAFFDAFDERALTPADLALFPSYLVCLRAAGAAGQALSVLELLSSGVPVKVLVEVPDLLEEGGLGDGHLTYGLRNAQVASTAVGLTDCFVMQSTSSNLYRMRGSLRRGLEYAGPALFSVFGGEDEAADGLPPYLVAAAAMQSRAFPAFTCDPAAGPALADRFSLEVNAQPAIDWPVTAMDFADGELQRASERVAFTFADFVASDPRHARHFARIAPEEWGPHLVPVDEFLARPGPAGDGEVPYVWAVDGEDVLHRVLVDGHVVQAARRCLELWHRLQELGGIHSSHAERLLERERGAWEAQKARELDAL
ncbi:MAG: hypothetical protein JSR54_06375, partial [Proteobacteria bacterium]|nr:hypothetical protein [Pseudomonadota bacterium]